MELNLQGNTPFLAVITKTINAHNFIKFHAWANSHVNFPYPVTGPLYLYLQRIQRQFAPFSLANHSLPVMVVTCVRVVVTGGSPCAPYDKCHAILMTVVYMFIYIKHSVSLAEDQVRLGLN